MLQHCRIYNTATDRMLESHPQLRQQVAPTAPVACGANSPSRHSLRRLIHSHTLIFPLRSADLHLYSYVCEQMSMPTPSTFEPKAPVAPAVSAEQRDKHQLPRYIVSIAVAIQSVAVLFEDAKDVTHRLAEGKQFASLGAVVLDIASGQVAGTCGGYPLRLPLRLPKAPWVVEEDWADAVTQDWADDGSGTALLGGAVEQLRRGIGKVFDEIAAHTAEPLHVQYLAPDAATYAALAALFKRFDCDPLSDIRTGRCNLEAQDAPVVRFQAASAVPVGPASPAPTPYRTLDEFVVAGSAAPPANTASSTFQDARDIAATTLAQFAYYLGLQAPDPSAIAPYLPLRRTPTRPSV